MYGGIDTYCVAPPKVEQDCINIAMLQSHQNQFSENDAGA